MGGESITAVIKIVSGQDSTTQLLQAQQENKLFTKIFLPSYRIRSCLPW